MLSLLCILGVEKIEFFFGFCHNVSAILFTHFDVVRIWRETEHMDCDSLVGTSIEIWNIVSLAFVFGRFCLLLQMIILYDYIIFYAYRVIYYYYSKLF